MTNIIDLNRRVDGLDEFARECKVSMEERVATLEDAIARQCPTGGCPAAPSDGGVVTTVTMYGGDVVPAEDPEDDGFSSLCLCREGDTGTWCSAYYSMSEEIWLQSGATRQVDVDKWMYMPED